MSTMTAVKNTTPGKGEFSTAAFLETREHFAGGYGQASPSLFAFFRFKYFFTISFMPALWLADDIILLWCQHVPFDSWGCRDQFRQL